MHTSSITTFRRPFSTKAYVGIKTFVSSLLDSKCELNLWMNVSVEELLELVDVDSQPFPASCPPNHRI